MKKQTVLLGLLLTTLSITSCGPNAKRIEAGDIHFQAAKTLHVKGDLIQALSEAQQAEQSDNTNEEVQNFLGLLFAERGDPQTAKAHFTRAVKLKPDFSEAHNNLCFILADSGKYDEALGQCKKAIDNVTYSTPERAYNNMAAIYEKKGDQVKAAEMHQKALIYNKKFVFSLLYLGKFSFEKQDYKKAKEFLQTADEACVASPVGAWGPSCPESQYTLALTYLQLKNTPQAVTAFKHCVDSDPITNSDFKGKCQKKLQMYK